MKYKVFCGSLETMKKVAERGVRGLNSKTMRWQIVDKTAKYEVEKGIKCLSYLFSDKDIYKIAEQKQLII